MTRHWNVLLLLPLALSAHAVLPAEARDRGFDCANPLGTMEADLCMSDTFTQEDRALNAAYREVLQQLTAMQRDGGCSRCTPTQLVEAQRHWLVFRDADCETVYTIAADGSGRNEARLTCLIDHTRTRIRQLDALYTHHVL